MHDEERLRALLKLDPLLDALPSDYFSIFVNDEEWNLSRETDFDLKETWIVHVHSYPASAALGQFGLWLENYVPEIEEETYLWHCVSIDSRTEALLWLGTCWFHELSDNSFQEINVDSEFLVSDDVDKILDLFDHLLLESGELRLNGATVHLKTAAEAPAKP